MAETPQVLERQARPGVVVRVDPRKGATLGPIGDTDDEPVLRRQVGEGRLAVGQVAEQQDPVGVRALEHRAVAQRHVRSIVDVTEEQPEPTGAGDLVDALQDLDVERVPDVPGDDPDERAPAAAQATSQQIGPIAQGRGGRQDTLAGVVADGHPRFAAVEDPRGGCDRHPGPLGDVAERGGGAP